MTLSIPISMLIATSVAFLVIVLLVLFVVRASWENRRLKEERMEAAAREHERDARRSEGEEVSHEKKVAEVSDGVPGGASSYGSIVMDEVVGEKIIEGLKESLRMTEEMYKKLSEKFKDDRDRRIELANDWLNYLEAVDNIKQSRIDYRMNSAEGDSMRVEHESARVKLEIENKFRNLLQSDVPQPAGQ
jgi:hypothetical protein